MVTEDYVSFETAKLLKEKGFDRYPLFPCYKEDNGEFIDIPTTIDTINYCFIPAPTLQMAMKWLREEKEVFITIGFCDYPALHKSEWIPVVTTHDSVFPESSDIAYDTYEQACEAAIKYCLENLV